MSSGVPDLLQQPVVHDRHPVGHRERLALVVRDVAERHADGALQVLELALHVGAQLEVERSQRLVQKQHLGPVHERPGERDPLLLAAGELPGPRVLAALELDEAHGLADPGPHLGLAHFGLAQAECDVLEHVQMREQRVALKHRVDRPPVGAHAGHVPPAHADPAGGRVLEPGDHAQRGGLAAARRADDREELAALDLQVEAAHGDQVAEALLDSRDVDGGVAHRPR